MSIDIANTASYNSIHIINFNLLKCINLFNVVNWLQYEILAFKTKIEDLFTTNIEKPKTMPTYFNKYLCLHYVRSYTAGAEDEERMSWKRQLKVDASYPLRE